MKTNRFLGSVLLISGTAIGAGMIALPVVTGIYGFFSALVLFIGVWLFTTYAAFLLLEANLWFNSDCNIITMAKNTLGKKGQMAAWILSILFLYTLMVAYISGMSEMFVDTLQVNFSLTVPKWLGAVALASIFSIFLCSGKRSVDYLNRVFILGLIVSYLILIFWITPKVNTSLVLTSNFHSPLAALPVALAAFGYTVVVPSVRNYLGNNVKQLKRAIIIGGAIPLIIYILWEIAVLGIIPIEGQSGLLSILEHGDPGTGITSALNSFLQNPYIVVAARFFVFFAIASSFTGVSLALFDFLADGLSIQKTPMGKTMLSCLAFVPPLFIALIFPKVFMLALGYAGVLNVCLFFILPAIMVWRGRQQSFQITPLYQVAGGKIAQSLVLAFSSVVIFMEMATIWHSM